MSIRVVAGTCCINLHFDARREPDEPLWRARLDGHKTLSRATARARLNFSLRRSDETVSPCGDDSSVSNDRRAG
jgi:hypothetical protein